METNYNKIIDNIVNSILTKIKKAVDSECKYDKTFTANVINVSSDKKTCTIIYSGTMYTVKTTIKVEQGNLVRVCAPMNNWSDLFVVENRSVKVGD